MPSPKSSYVAPAAEIADPPGPVRKTLAAGGAALRAAGAGAPTPLPVGGVPRGGGAVGAGGGGAAGGPGGNSNSVSGSVYFDNGLSAAGLTLRAYSIGFAGADAKLGETKTDPQGAYSISYNPGSSPVNLEVRAVDSQGKETTLSKIKYNAAARETLNLIAPSSMQPLAAEYQRISVDLGKQVGSIGNLGQAQESSDRQDLTLLNRATNWDARLIALTATAAQQTTSTGMGPDALFALYRVGLPSDPQHLALVPPATVQAALKKANQAGIISMNDQQIAAATNSFQAFAVKAQMAMTTPGSNSTFTQLLSSPFLNSDQQKAFAALYFNNPSAGAGLWQQVAGLKLPATAVDALKLQGKFFYLTFNNAALAGKIQQDIGTLANLSQLADKDYHDGATWKAVLTALSGANTPLDGLIPPIYTGKTADRLEAYAADLARKVRFSFPTQVTARLIEKKTLPMNEATAPKVTAFLRAAAPLGYELGRTPLNAFLKNSAKNLPPLDAASNDSLKTLHRLYQVTPSNESLQAAMKLGFTSAKDIASYSQDEFVAKYSPSFPTEGEAIWVYAKSQQVSSVTFNFITMAHGMDTAPPVFALSASNNDLQNAKNTIVQQFPTIANLFGSLDYCQCEDCRSVLSPAAYFVDLLNFLNGSPTNPIKPISYTDPSTGTLKEVTPLDILIGNKTANIAGRRPDLAALPLTCENTNTAMPYIDLVNEILEYFIANKALDAGVAYDTGSLSTADLTAEPQHILPSVYNTDLKTAAYPLNLPFDLWIETVRGFFSYFKNPLPQVLDVLRPADKLELFTDGNSYPYYRAQIFSESLGISPAEYGVFTVMDPNTKKPSVQNWFLLYGYADEPTALGALKSAKTLSQKLGLTYQDLTDLVTMGFLNPSLYPLIFQFERFGISMDDAFSYTNQPGFPAMTAQAKTTFESSVATITAQYKKQNPASTFDAKTWLTNLLPANYSQKVLVLHDPDTGCNFTGTLLQYADGTAAKPLDFLKFNLFVRLWQKLGWSMDETDRAMQLFFLSNLPAWTDANFATAFSASMKTALVYLAHLNDLNTQLNPALGRNALLPLWSDLPTQGTNSLYSQLFLTPGILNNDWAFDDPAGQFPAAAGDLPAALQPFTAHQTAVQGALGLTSDEVAAILADAGVTPSAAGFTLANLSTCYRYSLLAKCLQLPVADMLALKAMSGLNPFQKLGSAPLSVLADDVIYNQTLQFVKQTVAVQNSGFTVEDLKYLLRHQFDPVGKYQSDPNALMTLVLSVANGLQQIQTQNAVPPNVMSIAESLLDQQLSGLIPATILKTLFAMLTNSRTYSASLGGVASAIDPTLFGQEADLSFSYDSVTQTQTVNFHGLLLDWKKAQLEQINTTPLFSGLLDAIQQQAKVALGQSVGDLLGVWASLVEYEAVQTAVTTGLPANALTQADPALSLNYDQVGQLQWLGYRGVLTDAKKGVLSAIGIPPALSPLLSSLLNNIQQQAMPAYRQLVGTLLALWVNGETYSASQSGVVPASQIDPVKFFAALSAAKQAGTITDPVPAIQFSYDSTAQIQTMTCVGALTDSMRGQLAALIATSTALTNVLQTARSQAVQLFQSLAANLLTVVAADLDGFLGPFLGEDATKQQKQAKAELVSVFAPLLAQKLSRQLVLQALEANLGSDPTMTEALATDAGLLTDPSNPGRSLMRAFLAVGQDGVSATYYASPNETGGNLAAGTAATVDMNDPSNPNAGKAGTGSAHFEGYLVVPTDGPYRFFAELGNLGSQGTLSLDSPDPTGLFTNPILQHTATKDNDEASQFIQLKGGAPYHFAVDFTSLGANDASVLVQGENLGKGPLSQIVLYPQTAVTTFDRARMLLSKVTQILAGFAMDEREVSYMVANGAQFSNLRLSALPTQPSDDSLPNSIALFAQFLIMADYADLRKGPAGGSDGLVDVFQAAAQNITQEPNTPWTLLANLTRRDPQVVKAVTAALGSDPHFLNNVGIRRVWAALQLLQIMGIPVASLSASTLIASLAPPSGSPTPDMIAASLKNAVKARFTADAWRPIAKSIFDPLRQEKRDALVAYLIQNLPAEDEDQLFEYFLVDPGMEPVVQTSRLRLALSSVQTFIQRCLLNLETGNTTQPVLNISPTAIDADWWAWMKRYRVWQANREIFLFPENWMIPELRLDKTDLFETLEGALLQGDVTRDLVESAFLTYLQGLEERARLEVVSMYLDQDPAQLQVSTLHVLARTYSTPHKYFYRTYSSGTWSGWLAVTPSIDGNHIVVAIWRGRLNVFWTTFITQQQPPSQTSSGADTATVSGMQYNQLATAIFQSAASPEVQMQLHWCDYYQGKWSKPITSDLSKYGPVPVDPSFDPDSDVYIHVYKEVDSQGNEGGLVINLDFTPYELSYAFRVTSKTGDPNFSEPDENMPSTPYSASSNDATLFTGSNLLEVTFRTKIATGNLGTPDTGKILTSVSDFGLLICDNPVAPPFLDPSEPLYWEAGSLVSPFFYRDFPNPSPDDTTRFYDELTFFVQPSLTEQTITDWEGWALVPFTPAQNWADPNVLNQFDVVPQVTIAEPVPVSPGDPVYSVYSLQNRSDWVTNPATAIAYGQSWIAQKGGLPAGVSNFKAGVSGLAAGRGLGTLGLNTGASAALAGIRAATTGLVFVQAQGARAGQLQSINAAKGPLTAANLGALRLQGI